MSDADRLPFLCMALIVVGRVVHDTYAVRGNNDGRGLAVNESIQEPTSGISWRAFADRTCGHPHSWVLQAYPSRSGMSESDPKENSWKQGAKQLHVCSASLVRSGNYSTTRVGLRVTGWDTLWKLGEVAITASWISANCSLVPLPLMRTT